eukprot:scaffold128_cov328-Pavlova_lutheri.AAC.14
MSLVRSDSVVVVRGSSAGCAIDIDGPVEANQHRLVTARLGLQVFRCTNSLANPVDGWERE